MLDQNLIAAIEEAAIIPEKWPALLEQLVGLASGTAGAVVAFSPSGAFRYTETPRYEAAFASYVADGRELVNVRPQRALALQHTGFLTDLDLCTREELAEDQIYERFLRPFGFGWTAGTAIPVPSGDVIVVDLARATAKGPFSRADMEALDPYRPHLARAALLASRLGLQRARAAAETLAAIGLPAGVLAADGRLIAANDLLDELAPRIVCRAFGRIALADHAANLLLAQALAQHYADAEAPMSRSIPMPASDGGAALIAHIVPISGAAHDVFGGGAAMFIVTEVTAPNMPLTTLLTGLFDLTPAESRLARAVAGGRPLRTIAAEGAASIETLRTQLKSVMAKTGTRRQVDLVRLLLATVAPGRPPQNSAP